MSLPDVPQCLSQYPYARLTVQCTSCHRRGTYSVARLAVRFGSEVDLDDLLRALTASCPWQRPPGARDPRKYEARCLAALPGLVAPQPPAGPGRLRVIAGGKADPEQ